MSHSFAIGDAVTYLDRTIGTSLTCNITKVMPAERYGRFYHIRNASELFDRSVPHHTLTAIAPTAADGVFGSAVDRSGPIAPHALPGPGHA